MRTTTPAPKEDTENYQISLDELSEEREIVANLSRRVFKTVTSENANVLNELRSSQGQTFLTLALRVDLRSVVEALLNLGIDPNLKDLSDNMTALHYACSLKLEHYFPLLLDHKDIDIHVKVKSINYKYIDIVNGQQLLKYF